MIKIIEDFKRRSKIEPIYVRTTPEGMREFLADKKCFCTREYSWVVCIDDNNIPIAYFVHMFGEETDDMILQNIDEIIAG